VVDTAAPAVPAVTAISLDTGASSTDGVTSDNTLVVSGTAEANSTVTVYRDGVLIGTTTATAGGSWSFDYTGTILADGPYAFTATATDAAGNTSGTSPAFNAVVDTIAPAVPAVTAISVDTGASSSDGVTADNTLIVSGTAVPNSTVTVYRGGVLIGTTTATAGGTWSFDSTGTVLADGPYAFTATATDLAGNTSAASPA